jgi:hypothetical protein
MIARSFRLRSRKLAIAEADLRRDAIRGMSDMEWPLLAQSGRSSANGTSADNE